MHRGEHNDVWLDNGWVFGSQGPGAPGTDGPEWEGVPEGLTNVQPRAGDVIVSACSAFASSSQA